MNTKKVAGQIISKAGIVQDKVEVLRVDVEALLCFVLTEAKAISGKVPSKPAFLNLLAEIVDELLVLSFPTELVDDLVARKVLKIVDDALLSKLFGKDWFEKLQEKVG